MSSSILLTAGAVGAAWVLVNRARAAPTAPSAVASAPAGQYSLGAQGASGLGAQGGQTMVISDGLGITAEDDGADPSTSPPNGGGTDVNGSVETTNTIVNANSGYSSSASNTMVTQTSGLAGAQTSSGVPTNPLGLTNTRAGVGTGAAPPVITSQPINGSQLITAVNGPGGVSAKLQAKTLNQLGSRFGLVW